MTTFGLFVLILFSVIVKRTLELPQDVTNDSESAKEKASDHDLYGLKPLGEVCPPILAGCLANHRIKRTAQVIHEKEEATQGPKKTVRIHLMEGRNSNEGRIELKLSEEAGWIPVCGHGWNLQAATVVCKTLDLGVAQFAISGSFLSKPDRTNHATNQIPGRNHTSRKYIINLKCLGNESRISHCNIEQVNLSQCPGPRGNFAGVICNRVLPDLAPDARELQSSILLEDRPLLSLTCAIEENCLSSTSQLIQPNNPDYVYETRRLLKFTAKTTNIGTADFRPIIPKRNWQWHACHRHFHSMEVFAHFDLIHPSSGERVAEGHKASFCLEDNVCVSGSKPKYKCANFGDQGISVGCTDTYLNTIDCQWIDISDLPSGNYLLRVSINPERKVAELSFDNNSVICSLFYNTTSVLVYNCTTGPL